MSSHCPLGLCLLPSYGENQACPVGVQGRHECSLSPLQKDLKITHHADNTLRSFCKWQKNINMKGDAHPQHHDTAILLTRYTCPRGVECRVHSAGLRLDSLSTEEPFYFRAIVDLH